LDQGPLPLPRRWRQHVQTPQTEAELESLRRSASRGAPFGEASWQQRTAKRLNLQSTLRPRGRPRSSQDKSRSLYFSRQSILKRAFEGKLVPQDPSDEPATGLLRRINTQRQSEEENCKPRSSTARKRAKGAKDKQRHLKFGD